MIKFFRKIRYDLMEKNKTGKYLKYAIGEIVLVVIGILIALQINNANESRKTNNIKQNYYNQIVVDLYTEIENINKRIVFLDTCIASSEKYFKYNQTSNLDPTKIFKELTKVEVSFRYLAFNTNTIQTLESTGDIKLMPEKIRNSLIELKRNQEQISRVAKGNYEIVLNAQQKVHQLGYFRLLTQTQVKGLHIENNITDIILIFEGGIYMKYYTDKLVKESLMEMLNNINNIKELIKVELE